MYDPSSPLLRPAPTGGAAPAPEAKARFAETRLLDAVVWCEVTPGQTLTEADAMERFGLTRAAARAGLTRLGYDGWATPQPRTGWLILPVTGALIGHVLEARSVAERCLGAVALTETQRDDLLQIAALLKPLTGRDAPGVRTSMRHYTERLDDLLLTALDPFTAEHLRKLWHHTDRITRYLEDPARDILFHRADAPALVAAVLAKDASAILETRATLLDAQRRFFLNQVLRSDAPLTPGSGISGPENQAVINRRET